MNSISGLVVAVILTTTVACVARDSPRLPEVEKSSPVAAEPTGAAPGTADAAELQRIVQLAVLQPETPEFDDAWSGYIRHNYRPGMDVNAIIEKVIKDSNDFRRSIRVPGASGGWPRMSSFRMNDKMRALADAVIEDLQAPG